MFRIAMNAPIMAARMAIHTVRLARSGRAAGWVTGASARGVDAPVRARSDMASPLRSELRHCGIGPRGLRRGRDRTLGLNARDYRHAGPQIDVETVQGDLDRDALHHLGEIAGGVVGRQQ